MGEPEIGTIEPSQSLAQLCNTGVEAARLDLTVPAHRPCQRRVASKDGFESERFLAILQPAFNVSLVDIGRSHARAALRLHGFGERAAQRSTVIEPPPAVVDARPPIASIVRRYGEKPKGPGRPPAIAARFEIGKGAFAGLDCVAQPAGDAIDL